MASCRHCCLGTATEVTVGVIEKIILTPLMLYYFDCLFNMFDIKNIRIYHQILELKLCI